MCTANICRSAKSRFLRLESRNFAWCLWIYVNSYWVAQVLSEGSDTTHPQIGALFQKCNVWDLRSQGYPLGISCCQIVCIVGQIAARIIMKNLIPNLLSIFIIGVNTKLNCNDKLSRRIMYTYNILLPNTWLSSFVCRYQYSLIKKKQLI